LHYAADVERLEKKLGLWDVYAISTGAMFASGFFLLPGIAAANAGPSVVLAYGLSSLLMLPAMFSIAELSSAMPRAAGTYFFIHRSLGPWVGTVGGFGDWLVLSFKSAFALVGMGAYLVIFFDVPMIPLAVALTVAFGVLNVLGAKETAWFQKALVVTLLSIMAYYVVQGLAHLAGDGFGDVAARQFTPFMPFGAAGLVSTIGLVFISYAGLTKVAAAAEEIDDLDRNLPLGMFLALGTVAAIYVGGVYIMVGTLDPAQLHEDLTPVATAGEAFLDWLPGPTGIILVVIAAIAAFASTGNAGILTASRYPLAMARDELVWSRFDRVGRFSTPTAGILATCTIMIFSIVFLDVETLAKLGSAFLLFVFALVNLSVIIMRESRINAYAPGFRSPLYPWMQLTGVIAMVGLIATLGLFSLLFVTAIVGVASLWYMFYARGRVAKRGAVYTLFQRLGQLGDPGIDLELWGLLRERGTSDEDSYEELVARAQVYDLPSATRIGEVLDAVVPDFSEQLVLSDGQLREQLEQRADSVIIPGSGFAALFAVLYPELESPALALVRSGAGIPLEAWREFPGQDDEVGNGQVPGHTHRIHAFIILLGPEAETTQHLRILAELATQVEPPEFARRWRQSETEEELKEALLRHERFVSIDLRPDGPAAELVGRRVGEVRWPEQTLVALIRRDDQSIFPRGRTWLREGDRITVIGPPDEIEELFERYVRP
jgi:basic amino acid/polyamine antiporter, APA family